MEENEDDEQQLLLSNTNSTTKGSKPGVNFFRHTTLKQKLTLLTLAFVNFCASTCFSVLAPFFPKEANLKGASGIEVGMIFGVFELVIFISSPVFGNFLTRLGAKFMLLSGIMTSGTCSILFGFLNQSPNGSTFVIMCFLTRSVEALGISAFITASFAIVAYTFPNHVTTVLGFVETFSGLGMMAGPTLGGVLYQAGGFSLPFFVLGGMELLVGAIAIKVMPAQDSDYKPFKGSKLNLLKNIYVVLISLTVIAGSFLLGFLDPTLANHLSLFKLQPTYIGLIFLIAPAMYSLTAPLWGWISDKKDCNTSLIIVCNIFITVSMLLLGPAPFLNLPLQLWLVLTSLCIMGIFLGGMLIPTFNGLLKGAKMIGMEENFDTYGIVSGLFNSCFSLGAFIGPTAGGIMADKLGFGWGTVCCAALLLFTNFLFFLYYIGRKVCGSQSANLLKKSPKVKDLMQSNSKVENDC